MRLELCKRQFGSLVKGVGINTSEPCMLKLLQKQMKKPGATAATGICGRCHGEVKIGEFNKNSEKSLTKNANDDSKW